MNTIIEYVLCYSAAFTLGFTCAILLVYTIELVRARKNG